MLHTDFPLVRLRLRRSVVALCLLSVAFVAAFHGALGSGTGVWFSSTPAVYSASDDPAHSSDRLVLETCHICTAIASFDSEAGRSEHAQVSPLTTVPLVSFQPKVTGPPPKA